MPHEATTNRYTRGIAEFVSGLRFEVIPAEVRERVKLLMLDSLGCAIYGAELEWSRILQKRLAECDTTRACAVWGTREKLSAPHAALVNGTQVQGFELDDVHRRGILHVGAVVLPPLIAVTETRRGMSGKEFLTAAVAGYEVGPRVGMCMGTDHVAQGWHSGATVGVFSAAAGAARGLKLDVDKTVHALGIAGTQAAGLLAAQYGAMVKRMHAGRAAQSGLYGALFADAGFTGIINVFESEYGGYCTTFSRSKDRFELDELTAGFGSVWQTMGVGLKFYSCVYTNHCTLDALREMRAERPFGAKDVEKVIVHASQTSVEHVGWKYVPRGMTSGQLNLPYCVATFLIEGACFVDELRPDKIADPERMALADKVDMRHDPAITALGPTLRHRTRVEVYLTDGTRMERTLDAPRGAENRFASEADVVEKFDSLATHVMPKEQAERLRDAMLSLEKLENASEIAGLLACGRQHEKE